MAMWLSPSQGQVSSHDEFYYKDWPIKTTHLQTSMLSVNNHANLRGHVLMEEA